MLELADVVCGYGATPVLDHVSLSATPGQLVAIVGPNGAGKTTLARVIAGLLPATTGTVRIDGRDPRAVARHTLARTLAYLPQRYELAFPFTALDIVLMGRYSRHRGPGLDDASDLAAAQTAMARCDVADLADRRFDTLSGGERRRVIVAQALCQGARLLVLDEPTAALDPAHAIAVMGSLVAERDRGAAVLVVTHDLDLAARAADRVVVMTRGRVIADAAPAEVFARPEVARAFACTLHVGDLPGDGGRFLVARVIAAFLVGGGRLTRTRLVAVLAVCALLCLAIAAIAPLVGAGLPGQGLELMSPSAMWSDGVDGTVFWRVRLPRVLAALLTGAALAGAGCAFQAVLRNPLAEPFTLGVSSGASLAAVLAIRLGVGTVLGAAGVSAFAVAGAVGAVVIVWRLARVGDSLPPATLILAGVTVSMFCSAASLMVQYASGFAEAARMLRWMMGGIEFTMYSTLLRAAPPIVAGAIALLALGRSLNAMAAGPEAAASVGVDAGQTETIAFGAASLLVGASIAIAGPVGFVGLIVPHALRAMIGPDNRVLLPASLMGGAALVAICDTLARMAGQVPVGVITALLGEPFFLLLLVRGKRGADLWRA